MIENTPKPFRDFCVHLRTLDYSSKLEELTLLGDMGILNFIRAIILDVRQKDLTKLQRINIDEDFLCQMDLFSFDDGSTENTNKEVTEPDEIVTNLLIQCPVLLVGTSSYK